MASWNIQDSIKYISQHAEPKSVGRCARYVRTAMEAGGLSTNGRPVSAYQYKGYLPNIGFTAIGDIHGKAKQKEWSDKNAKPGDISVMDHGTHGHICMWNGSKWISDFAQNNMWPYKGDGTCTIFRFGGTVDGSLTPYNGQIGGGNGSGGAGGAGGSGNGSGGGLSNGNYELATKRSEQKDNILFTDAISVKKHLIAMILEGEGVICTESKLFKDKTLIEDTLFKNYKGEYDETRIKGLYHLYDSNITTKLKYDNNLSISEFIGAAVTNPDSFIDVGELGALSAMLDTPGAYPIENVEGTLNPASFAGKKEQWLSAVKSFGLTDNQANALVACMMYECGLNHTLYNKLEYSGKGAKGTEGWHCGEGTVGFTFWNLKERLIKAFNGDSRSKKKLATTWEQYSLKGPRIIDLSLEDAALFTIKFYQNLINKTKNADLDTCVAEFYLEKAGRGGSAKKGNTPYERAYNRSLDYMATHTKQGCKAKNTFLCTLNTARMMANNA